MNRPPVFPPMPTTLSVSDSVSERAKWEGFACATEAHEPGPYNAESDNYYCVRCKRGMGNSFYAAARQRDKLQAENTKLALYVARLRSAILPALVLAIRGKYVALPVTARDAMQSAYYDDETSEGGAQ